MKNWWGKGIPLVASHQLDRASSKWSCLPGVILPLVLKVVCCWLGKWYGSLCCSMENPSFLFICVSWTQTILYKSWSCGCGKGPVAFLSIQRGDWAGRWIWGWLSVTLIGKWLFARKGCILHFALCTAPSDTKERSNLPPSTWVGIPVLRRKASGTSPVTRVKWRPSQLLRWDWRTSWWALNSFPRTWRCLSSAVGVR